MTLGQNLRIKKEAEPVVMFNRSCHANPIAVLLPRLPTSGDGIR